MSSTNGHEWIRHEILPGHDICKKCGIVRRADDRNKPCKGIVKIVMRNTRFVA